MVNNKNMTAVDWLEDELAKKLKHIIESKDYVLMETLFEKAKQMEKEQIIDSFRNGLDDFYDKDTSFYENGEKYYNETYKQQDK